MYELKKKMERYLRVNLLGPGPRLMKKRIYWAAVSQRLRNTGLRYPAWNALAPYCHVWIFRQSYTFPHYLTYGTIFGKKKKFQNTKYVFSFSLHHLSETFFTLRRRYDTKRTLVVT